MRPERGGRRRGGEGGEGAEREGDGAEDGRGAEESGGKGAARGGARAEEPIRVTVVYFVTPVGKITRTDMERFAAAFEAWDQQAIWGGSFVVKEKS